MFYIWITPANLKIQLKPSMSEIRNYLVAKQNKLKNQGMKGRSVNRKKEQEEDKVEGSKGRTNDIYFRIDSCPFKKRGKFYLEAREHETKRSVKSLPLVDTRKHFSSLPSSTCRAGTKRVILVQRTRETWRFLY